MRSWKLFPLTLICMHVLQGDLSNVPKFVQDQGVCVDYYEAKSDLLLTGDPLVFVASDFNRQSDFECEYALRKNFISINESDILMFADLFNRRNRSESIFTGDDFLASIAQSQVLIATKEFYEQNIQSTSSFLIKTEENSTVIFAKTSQFNQLTLEGSSGFIGNTGSLAATSVDISVPYYNAATLRFNPELPTQTAFDTAVLHPSGSIINLNEFGTGGAQLAITNFRELPSDIRGAEIKARGINRNNRRIQNGNTGARLTISNYQDTAHLLQENTNYVGTTSTGAELAIANYLEGGQSDNGFIYLINKGIVVGTNATGSRGAIGNPVSLRHTDIFLENMGATKHEGIGVFFALSNLELYERTLLLKDASHGSDGSGIGVFAQVFQSINIEDCGKIVLDDYQPTLYGGTRNVTLQSQIITVGQSGLLGGSGHIIAEQYLLNTGTVLANGLQISTPLFLQTPTGNLCIKIQNRCDVPLRVDGQAALNGDVWLLPSCGFSVCPGDTFPIIEATNGISGEFACVHNGLPWGIIPQLSYQPNSVLITINCPCPSLCNYLGNFTQTIMSSITDTNNFLIKRQLQRVQQRIVSKETNKKMGNAYIAPIGSVGKSDLDCAQVGFDFWSAGGVIGADYAFSQGGIGGLVTFENIQSYHPTYCWGNFRADRAHASLYGAYIPSFDPAFSLDLMVGGGYDWYRFNRFVGVQRAKGSPNGYEVDGMLSLEYTFTCDDHSHIIPMANLQYIYLHVDEYRERGSYFQNIAYKSQSARSLSTLLGLWGDHTWQRAQPVTLAGTLGWQREYLNHDRTLQYSGGCLELEGSKRNNLLAGLDLNVQICDCCQVEGSYELIWNPQFRRNGFYLGLNSSF